MADIFHIGERNALIEARFLERPNRFLVICRLSDGERVQAFLPNPGRLWELLYPETTLYLIKESAAAASRKTKFTVVGALAEHGPVMLHTHKTNDVAAWLFNQGQVPGLEAYRVVRREVSWGNSRFDLLISNGKEPMVIEVKSCSLFGKKIAMFPDAPSTRALKHLNELRRINEQEIRAGILFIVQSGHPDFFIPDYHTDFDFSMALKENQFESSQNERLMIKALKISWDKLFTMRQKIEEIPILWNLLKQECTTKGYSLSIHMLENGQYGIHVLPQIKKASSRILAIRTTQPIEETLFNRLSLLCDDAKFLEDRGIKMFIFNKNPLKEPDFVQFLIDMRINRLESMIASNLLVRQ
ncbi:DNA/RNA nuclease SfsA [Aminobacterium sp. MB27-C1]|jgi:sugar fermentation stimulation protein A|uniref:DNA/RNA nuclease SfsA n=1 Tax=unclassified Aminobacterium TaxID=2685012 RepID=UPI001BCC5803|nr:MULTISPECIES: DNA/RNA nuclease SfsA [unclassified Aminobacterium]MEA4878243.1 DNA/RNA nuclease SfsA [Aminobacterium sp.]WMI71064.1 DNA/RNA nuclease SfsA [Aminobacterium sp. MB27-C1]